MTITIRLVEAENPIALVPLADKGHAKIYLADLEQLLEMGVSPCWNMLRTGYVTAPAPNAPGNNVQVARVLLDARPGYRVRYNSHDRTDLRRENVLLIEANGSSRRDRDFLSRKNQSCRVEFQYV